MCKTGMTFVKTKAESYTLSKYRKMCSVFVRLRLAYILSVIESAAAANTQHICGLMKEVE